MERLSSEVELTWADGDYTFALKARQIEELEHLCDEGIARICMRVFSKTDFKLKHIRETIRLGLIGGGTPPVDAARLVKTYVDDCPIDPPADPSSPFKTAAAVLQAAYFGWETFTSSGEAQAAPNG